MADSLTSFSGHRAAKARARRDFRTLRRGVENPDSAPPGPRSGVRLVSRAVLVATGLALAVSTRGAAQASGTLRAEARVIEAQAGQAVLAAARSVGKRPVPARADVGLATISVRDVKPSPLMGVVIRLSGRPSPRPSPPDPASAQPRALVPARIVSIQFLRN